MQTTRDVPTNNIGSANVYQASQISTLNNIPANSNLRFVSDDDSFHLYEPTILDNSVQYSTFETTDVTASNNAGGGSTGSYTFQFNNPNWVNTSEMYLEWPVTISVTMPAVPGGATPTAPSPAYYDPIIVNNNNFISYFPVGSPAMQGCFDHGLYPDEAVIKMFKKFEVYGATNNQPLGKTTMFDQPHLSTISQIDKLSAESAMIWGQSGIGISSTKQANMNIPSTGVTPSANDDFVYSTSSIGMKGRRVPLQALQSFEALVRMASTACGATNNANVFTNQFIVSIPLAKISEWFKTIKSVPPEFRYKLTLTYFNAPTPIYTSYVGGLPVQFLLSANTNINPQIKFRSFVLNPTLQEQLNLKWSRNVFTYNIETAEPYQIPARLFPYVQVIQTSQQRPLLIRICVQAIAGLATVPAAATPNTYYIPNQLVPWLDDNNAPITVTEIDVFISGKTVIRYENLSLTQGEVLTTGFENIANVLSAKSALRYSNLPAGVERMQRGTFTTSISGAPIDLQLTPSMMWDNSAYPTDQGAIQIKVAIKCSARLNSNFQITIYKYYTQQISVDTNLKATLTEWPARVVQNQGINSTLVQPTVIPGN